MTTTNPKHLNKLAPAKPAPLTEDEKAQQIARFLTQKREQFFQLILANLLQNPNCKLDLETCVDCALKAADYSIEKLYPLPKEVNKEAKDEA